MTRYHTRPVEVEAIHWLGEENCDEVFEFLGWTHSTGELDHSVIYFDGLDKYWTAKPGDWIVRHPDGDQLAFKPEEFTARYEAIPLTENNEEQQ